MQHKTSPAPVSRPPDVGEPAPFFTAATDNIDRYSLETVAGRWIVLMVFGTLASQASRDALELVLRRRDMFNDFDAGFYGSERRSRRPLRAGTDQRRAGGTVLLGL